MPQTSLFFGEIPCGQRIDATTIRVLFTAEERAEFERFVNQRGLKKGAFTKFAIMNEIARERRDQIEALR